MKKIFALILVIALVAFCAASCSSDAPAESAAADTAESSASAADDSAADAAADTAESSAPASDDSAADTSAEDSSSSSGDGDYFVGLAFGGLDATPTVLMNYETARMDELGWKYTIVNGDLDVNKYIADIENLLLQEPDIILARPMSDLVTWQVAELTQQAGIPLVTMGISMYTDDEKFWLSDVGDAELQRGIPLGEWLVDYCKEHPDFEPKIGFLVGDISIDDPTICARSANVRDALNEAGIKWEDVITAQADPTWSASGAMKITEDWLQRYTIDELNTILCWSDEMCVGVIQALQTAGVDPGEYLIMSYDGLPVIEEYVESGWVTATSAYDLEKQANAMIDVLQMYKDGKGDEIQKRTYANGIYIMDKDSLAARNAGEPLEYFDYSGYID